MIESERGRTHAHAQRMYTRVYVCALRLRRKEVVRGGTDDGSDLVTS